MTFEKFKSNVEGWAKARGIYEHSTALAQALKAVSESGELADAVIKCDKDALKDAVGDIAVCLVNVAKLSETNITQGDIDESGSYSIFPQKAAAFSVHSVSLVAHSLAVGDWGDDVGYFIAISLSSLVGLCKSVKLDFMDCCEAALQVIKNRTGKMVAGGAFVKDE